MACVLSTTGLNRGVKGVLTRLFVDFSNCTQFSTDPFPIQDSTIQNIYDELCCMRSVTPPPVERAITQDEGCMGENIEYQDTGPVTYGQFSVTFRDQLAGNSDWNHCTNGTVADGLADAFNSLTVCAVAIRHPIADPVAVPPFLYEIFDAQVASITRGEITKNEYREATVTFQPRSRSYCVYESAFFTTSWLGLADCIPEF